MNNYLCELLITGCLVTLISGCSGGAGSGDDTNSTTTPIGNVTGNWAITENVDATACGDGVYLDDYNLNVTMTDNSVSLYDPATGNAYSGTLNGNQLSYTGTIPGDPSDGGTVDVNFSGTLDVSCNSFSGTASWTWSSGVQSCSGTTAVSGSRTFTEGCGGPSGGIVPNAPSNLLASATSSSTINLSWADDADNENSFVVQQSSTSGSGFVTIATLGVNAQNHTVTGLAASTSYYFRVYASNSMGDSDISNTANSMTLATASKLPTAPTSLSSLGQNFITTTELSWTDNSDNETGFRVERSTSPRSGFVEIGSVSANITRYSVTRLNASTTYYFRVRAFNSAGSSPYTNTLTMMTGDAAPVLTAPSNATATGFSLTWTYGWPTGGLGSNLDGYQLQVSTTSSGSGYTTIYSPASRAATFSYDVSSPAVGTYYYRVRSSIASQASNWSNVVIVVVASSAITKTFTASTDSLLLNSSTNSALADTNYSSGENSVGCNWTYSSLTGISEYVCSMSLIYFSVDTTISGKTINKATLKLSVDVLPVNYLADYQLWAIAANWFPASVTWNSRPLIYTSSSKIFGQPITTALPLAIDVTTIVSKWADGSWSNFGFMLEDAYYLNPFQVALQASSFCSRESCGGGITYYPQLVIEYQ